MQPGLQATPSGSASRHSGHRALPHDLHTATASLSWWFGYYSGWAFSGEADVVEARAILTDGGRYRFTVTVRHGDTGWSHYADRWEVLTDEDTVLAPRVLHHPHENEQPFTRHLDNVLIPLGVSRVWIRAHDKVHEYGGITVAVVREGNDAA